MTAKEVLKWHEDHLMRGKRLVAEVEYSRGLWRGIMYGNYRTSISKHDSKLLAIDWCEEKALEENG